MNESRMTRGQLLKRATAAELALLAALGPVGVADAARALAHAAAATPKRGGTLKIGVIGNGTSETYNPAVYNSPIDFLHGISNFDPLVRLGPDFNFEPGLAVRWVPNKEATVWEIHLRQGVKWHDGTPFTADDVIYSLRQMGSTSHFGHFAVAAVDLKNLKKKGKYVVVMPMTSPRGAIQPLFSFVNTMIVKNGTKSFSKPVGTGPFILQSFTPGQQSVAKRNPDYWDHGKPYVDELQIISVTDPTTTTDALQSGQLNAVYPVIFPIAAAKQKNPSSGNWKLIVQKGGFHQTIYMRADQAPFNDARVRLAMKLIPERQKMIETVLAGFGEVGNDLFGKHLAGYAEPAAARPGHRQGQVAPQVGRQVEPRGDAADDRRAAGPHRCRHLLRAGGEEGGREGEREDSAGLLVLQPVAPLHEDAVRAGLLADRLALPRLPPARHLDSAGERGALHEPDVRRAGAGGGVDALAHEVEGLVDTGAAHVLAGLELHRLGPPPLDERHDVEPERRRTGLALPARRHEGLELVVLVLGDVLARGATPQPVHGMSFAGDAAAGDCGHRAPQATALLRFFLRRLLIGALTLLVASMLIFAATDLLPGSPASNALGKFATPEQTRALNHKLGYDHPLVVRYWDWLSGAVHRRPRRRRPSAPRTPGRRRRSGR